jgi:hypothetical protein
MNPSSYNVAVNDSVTQIIEDESAPKAKEDGRVTYLVQNLGPDPVYLGNSEVVHYEGFELAVGGTLTIAIRLGGDLFGVCDGVACTADVRVLVVP